MAKLEKRPEEIAEDNIRMKAQRRNTAIHSPLLAQSDGNVTVLGMSIPVRSVAPNLWLQNPRAMKLAQKDLLTEFRWCRDAALLLRDYALSLDYATMPEDYPWPERPSLPNRGQKKDAKGRNIVCRKNSGLA